MKNTSESLEQKIEIVVERLVREHLAVLEATASAAVREGSVAQRRRRSRSMRARVRIAAARRRGDDLVRKWPISRSGSTAQCAPTRVRPWR
jgi:hypothetical protein